MLGSASKEYGERMRTEDMLAAVTPQVYEQFKRAIELGKWPDGRVLTQEQKQTCMQAVIAYEHAHVPENERVGYVPPKTEPCATDHDHDEPAPLKWKTDEEQ